MNATDFLWVLLGVGFLSNVVYFRAELRAHQARLTVDEDRRAQRRGLWSKLTG